MDRKNVFLEFILVSLFVSGLSVILPLWSGWGIEILLFIIVAFLICFIGAVLVRFFPKARFVIWLVTVLGAIFVNFLLILYIATLNLFIRDV